jgi:hypothetical protein
MKKKASGKISNNKPRSNIQIVIQSLLTGQRLSAKQLIEIIEKETGRIAKVRNISSLLSKLANSVKCDLGNFIEKFELDSGYEYQLIKSALTLTPEEVYGLTLKTGKGKVSLKEALNKYPHLSESLGKVSVKKAKNKKAAQKAAQKAAKKAAKKAASKEAVPEIAESKEAVPEITESKEAVPKTVKSKSSKLKSKSSKVPKIAKSKSSKKAIPQIVELKETIPQIVESKEAIPQTVESKETIPQTVESKSLKKINVNDELLDALIGRIIEKIRAVGKYEFYVNVSFDPTEPVE